ncbi:FkbM family methyltransferase [Labrenzia sp. VG12]|uniref:FkbM family methyltransferase n=1 Tax=Labrenzia sp. VG12 TaxID=2021862 RepID=UPI0012FD8501|nr:FkbM family methyltransferase [Labrenzia sp. VG12]
MHSEELYFPPKASKNRDRFREVVSDPINILIPRHPEAGIVRKGIVTLHNGHKVPVSGDEAFHGDFSDILVINRGVHEPLVEYAFLQLLSQLPDRPRMLELGSSWAHYSMWMKKERPGASVWMVEPDTRNMRSGRANFKRNNYRGTFIKASVGHGKFELDAFFRKACIDHLEFLRCDIQGFEIEMLEGAEESLKAMKVDYLFVSTHSQELHLGVQEKLKSHGYRIDLSTDYDCETSSFDGFVMAVRQDLPRAFQGAQPLSRVEICNATPQKLLDSILQANEQVLEEQQKAGDQPLPPEKTTMLGRLLRGIFG